MEYSKTYWQDSPSTATPLSAANLNKIENGIEAAANAVTALETGKMDADDATVYHVDTTTQTLTYDNTNPKTIYLNARVSYGSVSNRAAVVISTSSKGYQFAITVTGDILMRSGGGTYPTVWTVLYGSSYKKNVINDDNKNSSVFIPTIGAVVSYLVANYIGNGSGTVTETNLAAALKNSLYRVDNTTETVAYSADNPRTIYTNARVNGNKPTLIFTLGDDSQLAMHKDGHLYYRTYANGAYGSWIDLKATSIGESNKTSGAYPTVQAVYNFVTAFVASAISGKESASNKLTSEAGIDEDSTDTEYPTAKAVFNFGTDILNEVAGDLVLKESFSNKKTTITGYETSNQFYPTTKAVYDYVASFGLTENFKQALLNCFQNVAWINNRGQTLYQALYQALYDAPYPSGDEIVIVIDGTSTTWELGYIDANGNITREFMQTGTYTSDFVNVDQKSQAVLALGGAEVLRLAFYDSSKTFISKVHVGEADVPANAAYLRATIAKGSIGNDGYNGAGTTITLYDALYPSENLVSISAVFTQGENVIYTTDSLDMLKRYLVVTAHYDDSSSKTITDYTLFGTLAAGTSVITVSCGGKTTTFNVTVTDNGIVIVIDGTSTTWEPGYIDANGNITREFMQTGTYTSDFVNVDQKSQAVLALDGAEVLRLAFYDSSKTFISKVHVGEADVPANAAYLRATIAKGSIGNDGYNGAGTTITLS